MTHRRRAGLVVPLFSIRTDESWGVGEIPDLARLAAWARAAGLSAIQILPVMEPALGQASPYMARTAFALDPAYIAVEQLEDFRAARAFDDGMRARVDALRARAAVDWGGVRAVKDEALACAFAHFSTHDDETKSERSLALDRFFDEHREWLDEYARYAEARDELRRPARFFAWTQWVADAQWHKMRRELGGVELLGDLPFVVGNDAHDVLAHPDLFDTRSRLGVPPDAFSEEGQDWGLPVYRWDAMAREDFAWFRRRAARARALFDGYRVDHVVGLFRTFNFSTKTFDPANEPEQRALGERIMRLLDPTCVLAEDLGVVPDFVRQTLTALEIPGWRVLRWEKDLPHVFRDPRAWPALSVAATGTHDTDPIADWWESMPPWERDAFRHIDGMGGMSDNFTDETRDRILDLVYASGSALTLTPYPDLVGARDRINVPGTVGEQNWTYRIGDTVDGLLRGPDTARLRALAEKHGRL